MRPSSVGAAAAGALLAVAALAVPARSVGAASLRDEAVSNYRDGRYEEAARLYQQMLSAEPQNPDLLRDLMWVLWKSERYEEASAAAARLSKLRPGDAEADKLIRQAPALAERAEARADFHAGRYAEAVGLYQKLSAEDPKNLSLLRDLMWSLWETERYPEAREAAARIVALDPSDAEAREMTTRAPRAALRASALKYYRAGRFEEAARCYRALAKSDPQNPGFLKDLFWTLWETEDLEEAARVAAQLTELAPQDPEAWNMLGRSHAAMGETEDAVRAYRQSLALKPDQPDTRRMMGRLYVDMREFGKALDYLSDLGKADDAPPSVFPPLAKAQFFQGLYAQSAENWEKAMELFPDNDNYKIHEARALYYGGRTAEALALMDKIADGAGPMRGLAIDFLSDEALRNRGAAEAARVLERRLAKVRPSDEPRLLHLASLQGEAGEPAAALKSVDRYLSLSTASVPGYLLKAGILYNYGKFRGAAAAYRRAQTLNPSSIQAREGLANAELALGRPRRALRAFDGALSLDPTDPNLVLRKSYFLELAAGSGASRALLRRWLAENRGGAVLPVLAYHGITPFDNDPILAHGVHVTTRAFDSQMAALKAAGYTPVTVKQAVDWHTGWEALPPRPVLITFDDGRLDSFTYGDPILKKHGLKATMFLIMSNVEGNLPSSYVSWQRIQSYARTGRWEFQAHGDVGHNFIPVDAAGRQGMFLLNRKWLSDENRVETVREWKDRIAADHDSVKRKIADRLGVVPVAYAFPEGAYGQIGAVNSPEVVPINLKAAHDAFPICFHQDHYGINVRSRDPALLARLEPDPAWTGDDLVRYLQDHSPQAMMNRRLLRQAVWEDRPHESLALLKDLRESGASPVALLGEEGRIRTSLGDLPGAWRSVEKSLESGRDEGIEKLRDDLRVQRRPTWTPAYTFAKDSRTRRSSIFEQVLRPFPAARLDVGLVYLRGRHTEEGIPDVTENAAGVDFDARLGLFQHLRGRALYHWFGRDAEEENKISSNHSGSLTLSSRWADAVETELQGGRALYGTARALRAEVSEDEGRFRLELGRGRAVGVTGEVQGAKLSDDNRRRGVQAGASLSLAPAVKILYRYTQSDMERFSPDYYSPDHLRQHQLGLQISPRAGGRVTPSVTYLPGVGRERGTDRISIADVEAGLDVRLGRLGVLRGFYSHLKTPTYRRDTAGGALTIRF